MPEPSTTHLLRSRADAKAKYFNAGRENGPWSVRKIKGGLLPSYGTFYTYADGVEAPLVDADYQDVGAKTGRMSAAQPNLSNLPQSDED